MGMAGVAILKTEDLLNKIANIILKNDFEKFLNSSMIKLKKLIIIGDQIKYYKLSQF